MKEKAVFKVSTLMEYTGAIGLLSSLEKNHEVPEALLTIIADMENKVTPLIQSDLIYFCQKLQMHSIPRHLILFDGLDTFDAFMSKIRSLSDDDFWALVLKALFELKGNADDQAVKEMIEGDDYLSSIHYNFQYIMEFKSELNVLKPRLIHFFDQFYKSVFVDYEKALYSIAQKECQILEDEYKTDTVQFVKNYIKVNQSEFLHNPNLSCVFHVNASQFDFLTYTIVNDQPETIHVVFGYSVAGHLKSIHYDALVKCIGEDTKLAILKMLSKKSMYASEMADQLNLSRATMSHHINQMTEVGAVQIDYTKGKKVFYGIDIENIKAGLLGFVDSLIQ